MIEFSIIKQMASIFTPEFSFSDNLFLLNLFHEISDNKFDGKLFSAPIPQDAPAEIPRLILHSKDEAWKLEVSLERINLIYIHPELSSLTNPDALDFGNFANKFIQSYKKKSKIRIQRLAFVIDRAAETKETTPAQYIANTFCKDKYLQRPFNKTSSFELHSLKKYEFKNFDINSWVRLKSGQLLDQLRTPILHVINDINTLAYQEAPDINFELSDVERFFKFIPEHLESILSLYFNK